MSERYTKLFSQEKPLYAEGSPVIIMAGALLLDNVGGNVLAQLKFKNVSPKTVKALTVSVTAKDTVGREIGKPTVHQYLDLNAERDAEFGQKTAISLPSENTRECEVRVLEAAFADNSVWTAPEGLSWEPVPEQTPLFPNDAELLKQYRMEVNPAAKSELLTVKDLWLCSCGAVNRTGENTCHCCETASSAMKNADLSGLRERCDARLKEEREAAAKAAEEHRIAAEKAAKKTKKILSVAIPAVIAVIAIVIVLTKVIIPGSKYNAAVELYDEGRYREAAAAFLALGDYKDSQARCFSAWEKIIVRPTTVAAGSGFSVAVKNDGTVVAAGSDYFNDYGQFDVSDWTDIVTIACGGWHTVGLKLDGTVVATGSNEDGECDVSSWTDIVTIACGNSHTVGLRADGTAVATGYNDDGRCNVSDWTDIVAICCGNHHTVGLKADGTVVATGDNEAGECDVSDWTDITAVACGIGHTVGRRTDGTVVATGYNEDGRCDVANWINIVKVSCGMWHTVGLKSDGTVVATGSNVTYTFSGPEYDSRCDVSDWDDIVDIVCTYADTVALKADGTVVVKGSDSDNDRINISDWTDIIAIGSGGGDVLGLKSNGTVVTTGGYNVSGLTDVRLPNSVKLKP